MQRSLGFWRSWALVVGTMIGNGIFLLPYTASALAEIILQRRDSVAGLSNNRKSIFIAIITLAFSLFAIVGSGLEVVAYGLLLLLFGLPIYYWLCTKNLPD
jgi:basic amino acid/polyamine antiporter, APA family